ncbi:hypothetical protein CIK05_01000 [Bdellovibrio sp. qaytius]|nr:hypothetical protein CIK05_01000 [Bdellovibrio sp. qaytius]
MSSEYLMNIEFWEMASYVVTVVALPLGIIVYLLEQRKERQNEDEELYQRLADEYAEFQQLLLKNADLRLISGYIRDSEMTDEQRERKTIIFDLLVSLFERAYILVYEENMSKQNQRLWATWEDYIRFWTNRNDFRQSLDNLLEGEDPEFTTYMKKLASEAKI